MHAQRRINSGRARGALLDGAISCLAAALMLSVPAVALAQSSSKSKPKNRPPTAGGANVKQLDVRVGEMQDRLLRDVSEISKGYEDAGEYGRAVWLLEVLEKLDPKLPGLQDKIKQLTDKGLDASEFTYELDVSKGWTPPIGVIEQGRVVRITADGDYKLVTSLSVTANGLPMDEAGNELVAGIPTGALMGVIINPKDKKPGKPFEIKAEREWTPRESGFLQLRLNLPSGHKSTGKLTIRFGGVTPLPN